MSAKSSSMSACGFCLLAALATARAAEPLLLLEGPARGNVAIVSVDFTGALGRGELKQCDLPAVQAFDALSGAAVPVQYVPPSADTQVPSRSTAMLVLRLPRPGTDTVRLAFGASAPAANELDATARLSTAQVIHDVTGQAGLPSEIRFLGSGRQFHEFHWNDRLYHQELGGFLLRHDRQAKLTIVSDGPICCVYRAEAAYKRADGSAPSTNPRAAYDWYYFRDEPVVYVTAAISQAERFDWDEAHFLELNFPGEDFTRWVGQSPVSGGELIGDGSSHALSDWAALTSNTDAIAMFGCGRVLVHDGRGRYGTYLHAAGDRSWENWQDTLRQYHGWLWIGNADRVREELPMWQQQVPVILRGTLTDSVTHAAIARARDEASLMEPSQRPAYAWRAALAGRLEAEGQGEQALQVLEDHPPRDWTVIKASHLYFTVRVRGGGIEALSLLDADRQHEHLAPHQPPLFEMTLRDTLRGNEVTLAADQGWETVSAAQSGPGPGYLQWSKPTNTSVGALTVSARAQPDAERSALCWQFSVSAPRHPWSVWQVRFPQLELAAPGTHSALLFPRGPGEVTTTAWSSSFSFGGTYPSGWLSMQFLASYDPHTLQGLYWGLHDPAGSTKDILAKSQPVSRSVLLAATHPAPGMGQPGNGFELAGEAVWQLLRGDWYDASLIYRDWARKHARWYPKLGKEGREDTPLWMRELAVWAQTGGTADQCVDPVRQFARFLDVPVGYHWYRWHQIPFDNDYPHYFPATDGFVEGVRSLQESQVFVMPYINGRLWDTRDRAAEDFLFSKQALPAATRDEHGQPFTETYGSKEHDGSSVKLGVMCPVTETWQNKMREINRRLFVECGVDGVYIDQVAAAAPKACMDAGHGHPTGGGHWWNAGYWKMLELIREEMRSDQVLTTECNAEPFLRWFDGYLTWHWQYDGQVPAFPAVYGGAIQMFGRAYRGGDTQDLALRMKAAQQLTFGEQIGWMDPRVIHQQENAGFLRDVVRWRWKLRRYFYAGEMLRPPRLSGAIPRVRADWQWSGPWWVETDAVLTGAWLLRDPLRVAVIFANVADQAIHARWTWDASENGIDAARLAVKRIADETADNVEVISQRLSRDLALPARSIVVFEIVSQADESQE